ncbi:MAG: HIT domain-containing protein [Kiritimatiellae bacterium]|nr:HIT domain-containing protein [Kiritimatiellia bacterium]
MNGCIFCKIAAGEIPAVKLYESKDVVAFLDVAPMEKGHALVVPRSHWARMADIPAGDPAAEAQCAEWFRVVRALVAAATEEFGGANILQCNGESAGQTVDHLHLHVIPRPTGRTGAPRFESGAAKYADDAERDAVADRLRKALAKRL